MPWQQLTLRIAATDLARTEAVLRLAGAASVAISDDGDQPILEPLPGTTPLWAQLTIRALFDDTLDLSTIGCVLDPNAGSSVVLERIDDDELARAARQIVRPVTIGPRLSIVPAEQFDPTDATALGLHMGLAFGTGQHPTTLLCLQWLEAAAIDGFRVIDYGCGSGVLALAAIKLGAHEAVAIDHEPQALAATQRNAELNSLEATLSIGAPESLSPGSFDLILANILAQPLIDLAEDFASRQAAGGLIVLSGILVPQIEGLAAHYAAWYESIEQRESDGWGLLIGRRRNGDDR